MPVISAIKAVLKGNPSAYRVARRIQRWVSPPAEVELALLPFVVDRERVAVDIGAHSGLYLDALLEFGVDVVAIEANPRLAASLERLYGSRARVICAAATEQSGGESTLRVPVSGAGLATVEQENALPDLAYDEIKVPRLALDDLGCPPVGFIKIDVEGHEMSVLRGAQGIIERDRPAILVEAEERHRSGTVAEIERFLSARGYSGLMLDQGRITSLNSFDPLVHQSISDANLQLLNRGKYRGRYVNNFIFVP